MPTSEELHRWMNAVAADADRQAFTALFQHFAPRVKGFLMRGGTAAELAEELAQETMVQLWRKAASFDPARAQLSTWVFTLARHLRIDQHRRGSVHAPQPLEGADAQALPAEGSAGPDALLHAAERECGVRLALAALPPQQRRVLQMSFFEEHSHAEIAQQLGIPPGTVKSRIRLAVVQLRRLLDAFKP